MSTMLAAFESLTAAGTERECALLTGTAPLDIQSLVPKDCLSRGPLCR